MSKDQEYLREFIGELLDNLDETRVALGNLIKQSEKFSKELYKKRDGSFVDLSRLERKSLSLLDLWMTLQQEVKESGQIMGDIRRVTSQRQRALMIASKEVPEEKTMKKLTAKNLLKEVRKLKKQANIVEDWWTLPSLQKQFVKRLEENINFRKHSWSRDGLFKGFVGSDFIDVDFDNEYVGINSDIQRRIKVTGEPETDMKNAANAIELLFDY